MADEHNPSNGGTGYRLDSMQRAIDHQGKEIGRLSRLSAYLIGDPEIPGSEGAVPKLVKSVELLSTQYSESTPAARLWRNWSVLKKSLAVIGTGVVTGVIVGVIVLLITIANHLTSTVVSP